jgi:hypothetical protein
MENKQNLVCLVCGFLSKTPTGVTRHQQEHNKAKQVVQQHNLSNSEEFVQRLRTAIKLRLVQSNRRSGRNALRDSTVTIPCSFKEFIGSFGKLDQLICTSSYRRKAFKIWLYGLDVFKALDPILGHDWFAAEKEKGKVTYVMAYIYSARLSLPFKLEWSEKQVPLYDRLEDGSSKLVTYKVEELTVTFRVAHSNR